MNLGIVRGRRFIDRTLFNKKVRSTILKYSPENIITGDAPGTNKMAREYAKENEIELKVHYANWNKYRNHY